MPTHPSTIGKFRILGVLGRGAMGVVYKAHDPDIDRVVAIKLVRADLLEGDDRAHHVSRFRNEAKIVGRCIHPNIVGIYDFSVHEGAPFLVLEYVDGRDLSRVFGRGKQVDAGVAGRVVLRVLDALAFAHGFGIIHRDIKPANILLTAGDDIKVTDFGISLALSPDATRSSVLVGTPCYMSPEQCLGGTIDARSDLFSLGCVLYELLAGVRGFAAANYIATAHRILHETPAPLQDSRPGLPASLVAVVDKALAKQPQDRFGSAAEMSRALRQALDPEADEAETDTTILPRLLSGGAAVDTGSEVAALGTGSLATIERHLAHHIGPIAGTYLRRALREVQTLEELCERLSELVPPGPDRAAVRDAILHTIAADDNLASLRSRSDLGPQGISAQTMEWTTRAMAQVMGPIAPRLLRRALQNAKSAEDLQAACLAMVEETEQRDALRRVFASPRSSV